MGNNNVKPDNQNEVYNKINDLINSKTEGHSSEQYGGITFKVGDTVILKNDKNIEGTLMKETKIVGENSRAWSVTINKTGETQIWKEAVMINKREEDERKKKEAEAEERKRIEEEARKKKAEEDRIKTEKVEAERRRIEEESSNKREAAAAESKRKAAEAEKQRKIRELNEQINKNKNLIENAKINYSKFQEAKKQEFEKQIQTYNTIIANLEKELSELQRS